MKHISGATWTDAARADWDAIVIGAGPAGAMAARQVALAGVRTLLLDAKAFPREKACGGFLNRRAVSVLHQVGLHYILDECGGTPVRGIRLLDGRRAAQFSLPRGYVISRRTFDEKLVNAAVRAGAVFMPGAKARVEPATDNHYRSVAVIHSGRREAFRTRVVICADGLARASVKRLPECATQARPNYRVGIATTLHGDTTAWRDEQITMVVARHGYVGLVCCHENQLNIAAALDPTFLSGGSIGEAIAATFAKAGIPAPPGLTEATWHGTPPLTSKPKHVAAERLFLAGDASGYVEPFTGEGMAAAFESAAAVTPLVVQAVSAWHPELAARWEALHRRLVRDRQATCRQLAWILRRPWAVGAAMGVCRAYPRLAQRLIARVN